MESVMVNGKLRRTILTKEEMKNVTTIKPEVKAKRDAYIKRIKETLKFEKDKDGNLIVSL